MVEISPIFGRGPRMSAAAYTGRAVAPSAVAEDAAESRALITKNSLQLGIVSAQIQGMTAQMQSLAGSLSVIATNLSTAQALQQQKDNQEIELERRLAEQKLREGKESQIEKKIQAAALAPAQKIATKAQFTLGRLGDFFISILGGWLLNQGVQTLKALSEGNKDKLNEIKNNVLKNLAIIGGIYVGIKLGIAAILGTFSVLGVKLLAVAAVGLFTKPGRQLLGFIIDAGRAAANYAASLIGLDPPFPQEEPEDDKKGDAANVEGDNKDGNVGDGKTETPTTGGDAVEKPKTTQNQWWDFMDLFLDPGEENPPENVGGPSMESSISSIKSSVDSAESISKGITKLETTQKEQPTTRYMKPAAVAAEPKTESAFDRRRRFRHGKVRDAATDPEVIKMIAEEKMIGKTGQLPSNMISSTGVKREVARKVSQPPEEPTVTVLPVPVETGGGPPQQAAPVSAGPIGGVDMFATSNDDNMYTFGAMSNYNVVSV